MQWVYRFSQPTPGDPAAARSLLGGKGASLAEMTAAGLRVPPGFTITTECCKWFYEHGQTWPEGLEGQVRAELSRLEQETGRSFGRGARPLLVSVRSGAAASMPGMMDTILNCGLNPALAGEVGDTPAFWRTYAQFIRTYAGTVAGVEVSANGTLAPREMAMSLLDQYTQKVGKPFPTEPWDALVGCINAVLRSWNSPRAIAYRSKHNIRGLAGTAVNVQMMFPSRVSGVLFTQNPNNLEGQEMVVEASYGLGESVVSGDVTPDRFIIKRNEPGKIQTFIGHKANRVTALDDHGEYDPAAASLSPAQIDELCSIALSVEKHYGKPMDLEWGLADGQFAVLQCRPIRGLEIVADVETARREEVARLKSLCNGRRCVWVTHNLGETLQRPTPLTWDIVRDFMRGDGGFGLLYKDLGYRPSKRVRDEGFLELICGQIYTDPRRQAELLWDAWPVGYDMAAIVQDKSQVDVAPSSFDIDRLDSWFPLRLPGAIWARIRGGRKLARQRKSVLENFEYVVLRPYIDYAHHKRAEKLSSLSTTQLLTELDQRRSKVLDEFGKESLKPGFFGGAAMDALQRLLTQFMGKAKGMALATELVMGLDGDITFEQDSLLYDVAHGRATMEQFLHRFGHRASGEMELGTPRWREDPAYLQQIVDQLRSATGPTPHDKHKANVARRQAAEKELPSLLRAWGASSFSEELRQHLDEAQKLMPWRETGKHYLMLGYELLRLVLVELAHRWNLGTDLFFLRLAELERFEQDRSRLVEEIARRKIRWQAFARLQLPDVVDSDKLDSLGVPEEVSAAAELPASAVASGIATGVARIVFDPRHAGDLGRDYILVCPSTDPGWTPLFINARGLVVERGGVLSHGAIVARDFGIPAVVCPRATTLIKDGASIRIDGNAGKITLINGDAGA